MRRFGENRLDDVGDAVDHVREMGSDAADDVKAYAIGKLHDFISGDGAKLNYCGPTIGGTEALNAGVPALNAADECCKKHDYCYSLKKWYLDCDCDRIVIQCANKAAATECEDDACRKSAKKVALGFSYVVPCKCEAKNGERFFPPHAGDKCAAAGKSSGGGNGGKSPADIIKAAVSGI